MRMFAVLAVLCALAPIHAQEPQPIKLKLHPTPASTPALKFRLLPELRDMQTGNGAIDYLRAVSPELASQPLRKEALERMDQILETPVDKLRGTDISAIINRISMAFADEASRCSHCDWELIPRARREGIELLLPDVQAMRNVGRQLAVRSRVAIAEGKFDDAHRDFRTCLAMSRHVGDGVTLIQNLVGIAMAAKALEQIEAWVGQSGAPNLYWALTDLPSPFIDLRRGFEGERFLMEAAIPNLRDAKPGQFHLDRDRFFRSMRIAGSEPNGAAMNELFEHPEKHASAAKEFLGLHGWNKMQLAALPPLEAVVLHQAIEFNRAYEDMAKNLNLPIAIALERNAQIMKEITPGPDRPTGLTMAGTLLPATEKVLLIRLRLDRRIVALRTIEAIRLHLTEKGKLPEKLDDITVVPVPTDPLTGKQFEYRREGAAARLIVNAPPAIQKVQGHNIEYVLTTP